MDDTCLANYTTIDFLKVWEIFLEGDIREPALHYFHARNIWYCERKSFMRIL